MQQALSQAASGEWYVSIIDANTIRLTLKDENYILVFFVDNESNPFNGMAVEQVERIRLTKEDGSGDSIEY